MLLFFSEIRSKFYLGLSLRYSFENSEIYSLRKNNRGLCSFRKSFRDFFRKSSTDSFWNLDWKDFQSKFPQDGLQDSLQPYPEIPAGIFPEIFALLLVVIATGISLEISAKVHTEIPSCIFQEYH